MVDALKHEGVLVVQCLADHDWIAALVDLDDLGEHQKGRTAEPDISGRRPVLISGLAMVAHYPRRIS